MAKGNLDRIGKELNDLRQRGAFSHFRGDTISAVHRLDILRTLLDTHPGEIELRRHAIVSSIAALQSFHRGILVEMMSEDASITLRASEMVSQKYSLRETLDHIGGGRLSAEELIAYLAPVNSVDDLMTWMCRLFDTDFKDLLGRAVPPISRDDTEADVERIVNDVPALLSSLGEAFRLRHILAHESAPDLEITHDNALRLLSAVKIWIDAVNGSLWMTLWRGVPLKQMEMNLAASALLQEARTQLAQAMWSLRSHLNAEDKRALRHNHQSWVAMTEDFINHAYISQVGSMWRAVALSVTGDLFVERARHIEGWACALDSL